MDLRKLMLQADIRTYRERVKNALSLKEDFKNIENLDEVKRDIIATLYNCPIHRGIIEHDLHLKRDMAALENMEKKYKELYGEEYK